jgi:hypothetical protein
MQHNPVILFFLSLLLLSGCAPLYVPNARNSPHFPGANEFQATASAGMGFNGQVAYSFSQHLAVTGNCLYANNRSDPKFGYRTQSYAEAGLGYFEDFDEINVELFGGFGLGKGLSVDSTVEFFTDSKLYVGEARYSKFYIQPSIMFKTRIGEWSLTPRFSRLYFHDLQITIGQTPSIIRKRIFYFAEPAITWRMRVYRNSLYAFYQAGFNFPFDEHTTQFFDYELTHAVLGLQFRFGNNGDAPLR